jgi:hypothetical protein
VFDFRHGFREQLAEAGDCRCCQVRPSGVVVDYFDGIPRHDRILPANWAKLGLVTTWSGHELELIGTAGELDIAVKRADGTLRRWTPIWVVRVGDGIYVRTWHRRDTGWYGAALRSGLARIRVPGLETDVVVVDVGEELRESVEAAYRSKYGESGSSSMVAASAAVTTLRLDEASSALGAGSPP